MSWNVSYICDLELILSTLTNCKDIVCAVNIQHDCIDSDCTEVIRLVVRQERAETMRTKPVIHHKLTPKYLLNTYSIHIYAHIYAALPSSLR
ncbi:hypothetical protein PAXINDRAFT_84194, partial [Paxillus involutus ATCC 200175]